MKSNIITKLLLILMPITSLADELGVRGHSFKIEEEAFTVMMKIKLAGVDMKKEKEKMQQLARDRVNNPLPVKGVTRAKQEREFLFNPTHIVKEDIILPCGKILHKAGTKVNPLETMRLNRRLFFIDSTDDEQMHWLEERLNAPLPEQKEPVEDRVILVAGSVFEAEKELKCEDRRCAVYFDQAGELTTRFGIKFVPAIASQEGLMLKVNEVVID